jgi:serine protease Do
MNPKSLQRLMCSLVIILVAILWVGETRAQTQAKPPGAQAAASPSSGVGVDESFHKARESFLKKDYIRSAAEIRKGAALLKKEAEQASGEGKEALRSSANELDGLADRVQKGAVDSERKLGQAFARADHALARYYHGRASESWARKAASETGRELKVAAGHLENALNWAGERVDAEAAGAIQEGKQIGERMEKGIGLAAPEVGKGIESLGGEIIRVGRKIALSKSDRPSSIRISEKTGGPVHLSTAIIQIARKNLPAVVYIEVTETREVENPFGRLGNEPFFHRFFGLPKMPRKFKQEVKGLGSGIIIDPQGRILTNNHVAGGATKMQVTLSDGGQYPGRLVGADPPTDLAVIEISPKEPLPYVTFGDSDKMEVGEWVVAIGAPQALEKSVTQGIISAKHRTGISEPTSYQDFLQTDAPINPGNSGGPLLNIYGQVIGVNTAIFTQSGGSEGIGFAIPSNMAVYVAKELMAHGKVERGWLGVTIRNLTPDLAKSLHLETMKGALVVDLVKGGPADKAGMKKNDLVIAYNGQEIQDSALLRNRVAETPIGQEARVTILRGGKKAELTVKIGSQKEATGILAAEVKERLGAEVRSPSPEEVEKYDLKAHGAVVISWLDPQGPLAEAGFELGDIILGVNGQPVVGVESFGYLVSTFKPKERISVLGLDHHTGNTGTIFVIVR